MLTRPHTVASRPRRPVAPRAQRWLSAPGSLTARLRLHGRVEVEVLHQGRLTLWPQERKALRTSVGHVREVILRIDGRPAVWARSSTSLRSVKGPWRAMKGLGTRPLAELLFQHHRVRREGLRAEAWATRSFQRSHVRHHWRPVSDDPVPMWARRSIFRHRGQALQVLESFAPWVLPLDAGPTRR